MIYFFKNATASGGLYPPDLYWGFAPGFHWGTAIRPLRPPNVYL
jgi:hypothetical protein